MSLLAFLIIAACGVGFLLLLLVAVVLAEVLASKAPPRDSAPPAAQRCRISVLMPAHNEAGGIALSVAALQSELSPGDQIVVVADNCSDMTYDLAKAAGATVVRRTDAARRGKGFALDFGVRYLAADPPDVVVILDADCRVEPGSIARLAERAIAKQRPIQAHYSMELPEQSQSAPLAVAAIAWRVKNWVRPSGLYQLGLPCQLMGTGMAFPWAILAKARLGSSELVEDLVLGLELAREKTAPLFCPEATVISAFPTNQEGQATQRARWETGHLTVISRKLPMHFVEAVRTRNRDLMALVLDAAVPPLVFLVFLLLGYLGFSGLLFLLTGSFLPALLAATSITVLAISVAIALHKASVLDDTLTHLRSVPTYALAKVSLYCRVFRGRPLDWVRTKRD